MMYYKINHIQSNFCDIANKSIEGLNYLKSENKLQEIYGGLHVHNNKLRKYT